MHIAGCAWGEAEAKQDIGAARSGTGFSHPRGTPANLLPGASRAEGGGGFFPSAGRARAPRQVEAARPPPGRGELPSSPLLSPPPLPKGVRKSVSFWDSSETGERGMEDGGRDANLNRQKRVELDKGKLAVRIRSQEKLSLA